MARRAPAAVRAASPHRLSPGTKVPVVAGLPAGVIRAIGAVEHSHLYSGAVARALAEWKHAAHSNAGQMLEAAVRHGCPCCDPTEARDTLERALAVLGPIARRALYAKIAPLDELFRRTTIPDPLTPPDWPWWRRRT